MDPLHPNIVKYCHLKSSKIFTLWDLISPICRQVLKFKNMSQLVDALEPVATNYFRNDTLYNINHINPRLVLKTDSSTLQKNRCKITENLLSAKLPGNIGM